MCHHRLFHYTDKSGFDAIRASGKLKQSQKLTGYNGDAIFGDGVYSSKMSPWWYSKKEIASSNWGSDVAESYVAAGVILQVTSYKLQKLQVT